MTKTCLYKSRDVQCNWMELRSVDRKTWDDLVANPPVIPNKEMCPLAIWGTPVPHPELTWDGRMRCIGANVDTLYAFFLDFDNGTTIEEFKEKYRKFRFTLYTSYSYGKKPGDRFRVVLPLARKFPLRYVSCPDVKANLLWHFQGVDSTCFDNGHWQKLPAISSKDAPYVFYRNEGTCRWGSQFPDGWVSYEKMFYRYLEQLQARPKPDQDGDHSGAIRYAQEQIDATAEGARDKTLFRMLSWLHDIGAAESEAMSLRVWPGFESALADKVRRIFR